MAPTPVRHFTACGRWVTQTSGAASQAMRPLIEGPRRRVRVVAVFRKAVYVEAHEVDEPRVLGLVTCDAARLPNAVVVAPGGTDEPFRRVGVGEGGLVGQGSVDLSELHVRVRRWWEPTPVLGSLTPGRLAEQTANLARLLAQASRQPGLAGHDGPDELAACCARGDLAGAVEVAERLVGLGPGLTPSGDDIIAGLLLALRLVGDALPGGERAVWLAAWLGAAVTHDATRRTTSLAATLLHCAAHGQPSGEAAAVLRGLAGQESLRLAVRRLLATGHTSGADLAVGLLRGCEATARLVARGRRPRPTVRDRT